MAINRREFLSRSLTTVAAASVLGSRFSFAAQHKAEHIGVQLYTVRDAMQQDMDGTLAKVAAIGYKEVELAGFTMDDGKILYFTHSPQDLKASLDQHGLTAVSTHVNFKSLSPENFPKVIEVSNMLGHHYIVNPWIDDDIRKQPDGWKQAAATFNRAGEMSKKSGMQFAYHNHWFEWFPVDGKLPYDILLQESDPSLVKMEMDLCWITIAGQDPVKYFDRYPGRFPLVHVKDMKKLPKVDASGSQDFGDSLDDMTEVGSGVIDWKRIFAHADKGGIKHYIVEHDKPKDGFESIKTSYQYMQALRF
jgi:sugar phosphate isomerase/epimerase